MAIKETLQDSKDRLDALLEYANGVTGQEDSSLGDAVKTLCDGYGQGGGGGDSPFSFFEEYAINFMGTNNNPIFGNANFPNDLHLHFKNCVSFSTVFADSCPALPEGSALSVESDVTFKSFGLRGCPYETITVPDLTAVTNFSDFFRSCKAKYIVGVIDFNNHTVNANSFFGTQIVEVRFTPNRINADVNTGSVVNSVLSDESLVSIINVFIDNCAKTLTLRASLYDRLAGIIGISTSSDDGSVFQKSASGNTNLFEFAQNVKKLTVTRRT